MEGGEGPMKTLFWLCEKCGGETIVEPMETTQHRCISCGICDAVFAILNSKLSVRESPTATDRL